MTFNIKERRDLNLLSFISEKKTPIDSIMKQIHY